MAARKGGAAVMAALIAVLGVSAGASAEPPPQDSPVPSSVAPGGAAVEHLIDAPSPTPVDTAGAAPAVGADSGVRLDAAAATDLTPINRSSRAAVRTAYLERYASSRNVAIGWTGRMSTCRPGTISPAAFTASLRVVNYYRALVGVDPVTFDPVANNEAQAAALIMAANGQLSHAPPPSWKCWSELGSRGASRSNLVIGTDRAVGQALDLYMVDPGSQNVTVGHRDWMLDPTALTMGVGYVENANALHVISDRNPGARIPPVIAWPPAGFVPADHEPNGRWSLNLPTIEPTAFRNATVAVRESSTGKAKPAKVVARTSSLGVGPLLVWETSDIGVQPLHMDRTFRVTVSGISSAVFPATYSYTVTLFDPQTAVPPTSNPAPPGYVTGVVNGAKVKGRVVEFSGIAMGVNRAPIVTILRNGTVVRRITPSRPAFGSYKGWRYEERVAPGTHTFCARLEAVSPPAVYGEECRTVVVK